jgi:hypothetical protein
VISTPRGLFYKGLSRAFELLSLVEKEFLAPSIRVVNSRARQLCQSKSSVVHHTNLASWSACPVSSLCVVLHRSGGEPVPIDTARQSRPVPGATLCHFVMMKACPPCHDDVASIPLRARDGRIVAAGCHSIRTVTRGGGGWPCTTS